MIPAFDRLQAAKRLLVSGCGGGFDIYAGIPIVTNLIGQGKEVVLANLSFTNLSRSESERVRPSVWRVDRKSVELPYFPEKWLSEWFSRKGDAPPIYAFERASPSTLTVGYDHIISKHDIDLVLLIDGGTDSILFGDEPGLGTVVEDAVSIVAANAAAGDLTMLAAIGFGIDHFHGVSHHSFLENAATLTRDGGYLGTASLTLGTDDASDFIDVVEYANQRQPKHKSIVLNSILSALRGEFGNYHSTDRTADSELFINPLMAQYWYFGVRELVGRMRYSDELSRTTSWDEAQSVIEHVTSGMKRRPRVSIPL